MRAAGRQTNDRETPPGEDGDAGSAERLGREGSPAIVLLAPVRRGPGPAEMARKPEQAPAREPRGEGSQTDGERDAPERVDRRQLAQRVYRLMRQEMIMERERIPRSGG
jgi:hypothetical protein